MSLPLTERLSQPGGIMPSPNAMNWRAMALAALETYQREQAIYMASQARDKAVALAKVLTGLFGQQVYATHTPIEFDGLRFEAYSYDGLIYPRLLGTCADCGREFPSPSIFNLVQLGQLLQEFVPIEHVCRGAAPRHQLTSDEQLATILRDLIDERVDHILSTRGSDA